ncbi:oxidoreductase-like domain-containing protein [Nitrincola sp.]
MLEPLPPAPGECCGGGSCCPCVWDYYYQQRRLWVAQQLAAEAQESKA